MGSKNKRKIRKNKNIKNIKDLYRNATYYSNLRIAKLILLLYVLIKHDWILKIAYIIFIRNIEHLIFASTFTIFLSPPWKKYSTGRITVITSPENSSEFRREGKPNSTNSIQDRCSFFCSIRSGEKNRVFQVGERIPCTFRGISRKDTLRKKEG